jgi:kinesin family protein 2/24
METLFANYLQNRSSAPTVHNNISSRSHAIFKITANNFKIGIVDLAGSERVNKTTSETNTDMKETIFINRSLLTLKKCIRALEERSNLTQKIVLPYRESKLTQALIEYFVNNSKINIIVNINQARHCLDQNLNVMDYTSKAKNIKANATNDFSKMMKILTSKKKTEALSVIKPKNFLSNTQ